MAESHRHQATGSASASTTTTSINISGGSLVRGNSVATLNQIYQHQNSIPVRNRLLNTAKSLYTSVECEQQFSRILLNDQDQSACPSVSPQVATAGAANYNNYGANQRQQQTAICSASRPIETNESVLQAAQTMVTETGSSTLPRKPAAPQTTSAATPMSTPSNTIQIINVGRRHRKQQHTGSSSPSSSILIEYQQQQQQLSLGQSRVSPSRLPAKQQQQPPASSSLVGDRFNSDTPNELCPNPNPNAAATDQLAAVSVASETARASSPIILQTAAAAAARSPIGRTPSCNLEAAGGQFARWPAHPNTPPPSRRHEQQPTGALAAPAAAPDQPAPPPGATSPRQRRVLPTISQQQQHRTSVSPSTSTSTSSAFNCHRRLPQIPPLAVAQALAQAQAAQQQQAQRHLLTTTHPVGAVKTRSFDSSYSTSSSTTNQQRLVSAASSASSGAAGAAIVEPLAQSSSSGIVWPRFDSSAAVGAGLQINSRSSSSSQSVVSSSTANSPPRAAALLNRVLAEQQQQQQQQQLRVHSNPMSASGSDAASSSMAARHSNGPQLARANTLVLSRANSQVLQPAPPLSSARFDYVDNKQRQLRMAASNVNAPLTRASSLITPNVPQLQKPPSSAAAAAAAAAASEAPPPTNRSGRHRLAALRHQQGGSSGGNSSANSSTTSSGSSNSPAASTNSPPQTSILNTNQRQSRVSPSNRVGLGQSANLYFTFDSPTGSSSGNQNDTIYLEQQQQQQRMQAPANCTGSRSYLRAGDDSSGQMTSWPSGSSSLSSPQMVPGSPSSAHHLLLSNNNNNDPSSDMTTTTTTTASSVRGRRLSSCGSDLRANFLMNKQHAISDLTPPRSLESSASTDQQQQQPPPHDDQLGSGRPATPVVFSAAEPGRSDAARSPGASANQQPQRRAAQYTVACAPVVFIGMHSAAPPGQEYPYGGCSLASQQQLPSHLERLHQYQYQYQSGSARRPSSALAGLPPRAASASESSTVAPLAASPGLWTGANHNRPMTATAITMSSQGQPQQFMLGASDGRSPATNGRSRSQSSMLTGAGNQSISAAAAAAPVHSNGGQLHRHHHPAVQQTPTIRPVHHSSHQQQRSNYPEQPAMTGGSQFFDHYANAAAQCDPARRTLVPHALGMTNALSVDVYESGPSAAATAASQLATEAGGQVTLASQRDREPSYLLKRASTLIPAPSQRDRQPSNVSSSSMPAASQLDLLAVAASASSSGAACSVASSSASPLLSPAAMAPQRLIQSAASVSSGGAQSQSRQQQQGRKFGVWAQLMAGGGQAGASSGRRVCSAGQLETDPPARLQSSSASSSSSLSPSSPVSLSGCAGRGRQLISGEMSSSSSSYDSRDASDESPPTEANQQQQWRRVIRVCDRRRPKRSGAARRRRRNELQNSNMTRPNDHDESERKQEESVQADQQRQVQRQGRLGEEKDRLTLEERLKLAERSANELFRKVELSPVPSRQASQSDGLVATNGWPPGGRGGGHRIKRSGAAAKSQSLESGAEQTSKLASFWAAATGSNSSEQVGAADNDDGLDEATHDDEEDSLLALISRQQDQKRREQNAERQAQDEEEEEADDLSLFLRSLDKQQKLEQDQRKRMNFGGAANINNGGRCNNAAPRGSGRADSSCPATAAADLKQQTTTTKTRRRLRLAALGASFRMKSNNNREPPVGLFVDLGDQGADQNGAGSGNTSSSSSSVRVRRAVRLVRRAMTLKSLMVGLSSGQQQPSGSNQSAASAGNNNGGSKSPAGRQHSHLLSVASDEAADQMRRRSQQSAASQDSTAGRLSSNPGSPTHQRAAAPASPVQLKRRVIDSLASLYNAAHRGSSIEHTCSPASAAAAAASNNGGPTKQPASRAASRGSSLDGQLRRQQQQQKPAEMAS